MLGASLVESISMENHIINGQFVCVFTTCQAIHCCSHHYSHAVLKTHREGKHRCVHLMGVVEDICETLSKVNN